MLRDRASLAALALALVVHVLVVAPVWGGLALRGGEAPPDPPKEPPLRFTFVDPANAPEEPPDIPTPLLSTRDGRAAQPEAPDRPRGEAFQAGSSPIPQPARPAGTRGEPGAAAPAPGAPAESRAPPAAAAQGTNEGAVARADIPAEGEEERVAARIGAADRPSDRAPAGAGPLRPGIGSVLTGGQAAGDPLPAPATDQRATRARAGSSFSLNTTAWEYGPYMARLKREIEEQIFPPPAFYYGTAAWATRVRFRIAPDGRLAGLELLDHRGVRNLQYVALSAVDGAADFEPLPPGFPEPFLEITGNFYFNASPSGR